MNSSSPEPNEPMVDSPASPDESAFASASPLEAAPSPPDIPQLFVPVVLPELDEDTQEEGTQKGEKQDQVPLGEVIPDPLEVKFSSPPDVAYQASLTLELRCTTPEASIRFGIDASEIDESSELYDPAQKIFLTQSATIAARAFLGGQTGPLAFGNFEIAKPGWQKLEPTDPSDPTAHEASDQAVLEGPWHLAAASVRGKLHAHRASWREDAFQHGVAHAADGTFSIVVVSDGAGSAPLSRVASNLVCQTALDSLRSALPDNPPLRHEGDALIQRDLPLLREQLVIAAQLALEKVRAEAASRNRPLSEFSATLLILVRREWNGQQLCAALQCGDGSIALWNEDETLTLLGVADHGQQSGETRFLTSNGMEFEFSARVKFSIRPNLRAVAVMSDGVADDYFPESERLPELFRAVLPVLESADSTRGEATPQSTLLDWIRYEKKGSSDDRTLVMCWRAGSPALKEETDAQL